MKNIKKLLFISTLVAIACFGAVVHKPSTGMRHIASSQALKNIKAQLEQREQAVWQQITQATGITREQVVARQHNRHETYKSGALSQQRRRIAQNPPLSQHMIKEAKEICKAHGLDVNQVTIAPFMSPGAGACANDYTVFIDEFRMSLYPESARRFILAHELAHIKRKDSSFNEALKDLLSTSHQQLQNKLCKLRELHADLEALSLGPEYAESALNYGAFMVKRTGDHAGMRHPSARERLAMMNQAHGNRIA